MNTRLGNGLKACALMALASATFGATQASAKDGARSGRCDRERGYEVRGTIEAGGVLERVAGGATARRGDDRYSGTLVVDVLRGNKRGRRDLGRHTYEINAVRLPGIPAADQVAPAEGSSITLGGKMTAGKRCAAPARAKKAETADPDAAASSQDGEAGAPVAVADVAVEPGEAPIVTDVVVRVVRLGSGDANGGDQSPGPGDAETGDDHRRTGAAAPVEDDRPAPRADDDSPRSGPAEEDDDDRAPAPVEGESDADEG